METNRQPLQAVTAALNSDPLSSKPTCKALPALCGPHDARQQRLAKPPPIVTHPFPFPPAAHAEQITVTFDILKGFSDSDDEIDDPPPPAVQQRPQNPAAAVSAHSATSTDRCQPKDTLHPPPTRTHQALNPVEPPSRTDGNARPAPTMTATAKDTSMVTDALPIGITTAKLITPVPTMTTAATTEGRPAAKPKSSTNPFARASVHEPSSTLPGPAAPRHAQGPPPSLQAVARVDSTAMLQSVLASAVAVAIACPPSVAPSSGGAPATVRPAPMPAPVISLTAMAAAQRRSSGYRTGARSAVRRCTESDDDDDFVDPGPPKTAQKRQSAVALKEGEGEGAGKGGGASIAAAAVSSKPVAKQHAALKKRKSMDEGKGGASQGGCAPSMMDAHHGSSGGGAVHRHDQQGAARPAFRAAQEPFKKPRLSQPVPSSSLYPAEQNIQRARSMEGVVDDPKRPFLSGSGAADGSTHTLRLHTMPMSGTTEPIEVIDLLVVDDDDVQGADAGRTAPCTNAPPLGATAAESNFENGAYGREHNAAAMAYAANTTARFAHTHAASRQTTECAVPHAREQREGDGGAYDDDFLLHDNTYDPMAYAYLDNVNTANGLGAYNPGACLPEDVDVHLPNRPQPPLALPLPRQADDDSQGGNGEPWWRRLPDLVPVAVLDTLGKNPRDDSIVHIAYGLQFSGKAGGGATSASKAAARKERADARKKENAARYDAHDDGGGSERLGDASPSDPASKKTGRQQKVGRWITLDGQRVYVDAHGQQLTGSRAYKTAEDEKKGNFGKKGSGEKRSSWKKGQGRRKR